MIRKTRWVMIAAGEALFFSAAGCSQSASAPAGEQHGHARDPAMSHHDHAADSDHDQHGFEDAAKWAERFEAPERDSWQKPDQVIASLKIAPDAKVADIGSATGYFPVRFARAAPQGMVYGLDIEQSMVDYLNQRAKREGLTNLQSLRCPPDEATIPEPVDLVFICDTYHHIDHRVAYLRDLKSKLKPGGRVVIVDFKKIELPVGPPIDHKIAAWDVVREFVEAGYELRYISDVLPYQYFLTFYPQ